MSAATPRIRAGILAMAIALAAAAAFSPAAGGDAAEDAPAAAAAVAADIIVYGGTSGGIAAAVQAARMGRSVILIEPTQRLGGLTTGGLGQTDIGNKAAIGGIAREFYECMARHYAGPAAWRWQRREEYESGGQSRTDSGEAAQWTFEPSAAVKVFDDLVREAGVRVARGERLDRGAGVRKTGARIESIVMESGRAFRGRVFIDATYEGDLLAAAGVSYTWGREGNEDYGETLNGVQTARARSHQLVPGVDPYVRRGDPSSGLLPGIDPEGPGVEGGGDRRVQAYCFRMCLTDHPDNRLPFEKPAGYREIDYELLFRNFEAGETAVPWNNSAMPNRKTDVNNNKGFSTDFIGQSYGWPEASYAERDRIRERHLRYQQGLMWTLAHHPRVPESVRREVARWGPCKDEFVEGGGWQEQLYVREARRLRGALVMTQHHCQGREVAADAIGMAAYTMDSHNVQRHVDANGHARNEGDVQVGGFPPYPISYRAITPRREECDNLLVPVCLSASHIAFGSIRMEPVFMALGQSAATAAAFAIEADAAVQAVDYGRLRARLLADGQVLEWRGAKAAASRGKRVEDFEGIVIDDADARVERAGFGVPSTSVAPYLEEGYVHDGNQAKGEQRVVFRPRIDAAGRYEARLAWTPHTNRARAVPVTIRHADGETVVTVDQRARPGVDGLFGKLGVFRFAAGDGAAITVSNRDTDGFVVVDGVQLVAVPEGS